MITEGQARSLSYVRDAIARVPRELARALESPLPRVAGAVRSVVTSGIGASEGPARILAASLAEAGFAARFCAVSEFSQRTPAADLLVVFSQGLSPNARLAFASEQAFAARWLVTSFGSRADPRASTAGGDDVDDATTKKRAVLAQLVARGVTPIVIPPAHEPEALARFCGPTVAALSALRLSALLSGDRTLAMRLAEAPLAYQSAAVQSPLLAEPEGDAPLALVTAGALSDSAYAQRWKLLEALLVQDPAVWDVLQFAHGPLQAFHGKRLTLLVLEGARSADLVDRLVRTLDPERHRVLRLCASLPAPLSFFQHTAQLDALLLAQLERTPRDLFDWPGRHGDAALYAVGDEALPARGKT